MTRVGFAARSITPPIGEEIPGLFHRRVAEGVEDDLFVRAVVIDDGAQCVALVQVDAIAVPGKLVTAARRTARRLCGIPGRNCLIAATHTHSGGPVADIFMSFSNPGYIAWAASQAASAIAEAYEQRHAALVGSGTGLAPGVAFNRRFVMRDGKQVTHPGKLNPDIDEPAGAADPGVTVVGFAHPKTLAPFGCIVHFACHATHMNGTAFSADYPRWIVDTLQAVYGPSFGVVFLNGPCGDVTQVDNRSARPPELGPYWCERTGRAVGGAALQALATLDYARKAGVDSESRSVRAAIRTLSRQDLAAARPGSSRKRASASDVETLFANELLHVAALRRKQSHLALEVQAIRIADALFWSAPGELFQVFAERVRKASPFPKTCGVSLANGYAGYLCTPEAFDGCGYETRTARSSLLAADAGDRIVGAADALAELLYHRAERELRVQHKHLVWPKCDDPALDGIRQLNKGRSPRGG